MTASSQERKTANEDYISKEELRTIIFELKWITWCKWNSRSWTSKILSSKS